MSRRHADNWSHSGHYLVDPYTWPWSPNGHGHGHPLCAMCIGPPILRYSYFKIWPWKSMVKVMCVVKDQGHIWPSKFEGQGYARSSQLVTFEAWSSIDMFAFLFVAIDHFWLRYINFYIWPWKLKVNVMAKVKPDGRIWTLEFNRYVCFSFRGNRTIFGWYIANSIFDLENLGQGRPKSNQEIYRSGSTIVPKWKKFKKLFKSYGVNKNLRPAVAAAAAYEPVQKHKVTPVYRGDLIRTIYHARDL